MKTGIERIADERQRQIEKEGWTPEHDDEHTDGSLAMAAVCYASPEQIFKQDASKYADKSVIFRDPWPWDGWDKRKEFARGNSPIDPSKLTYKQRVSLLEKAGGLIAAEIDRLNRRIKKTIK